MSRLDELIAELCPNGVEFKPLGEVCRLVTGATPSKTKKEYWENGAIPWMSSGEVNLKRVFETENKITQLGYDNTSTTLVPVHSVVIALAGQGKTRGKVAITEIELCTNQSLCSIICSDYIDYKFLYYYLDGKYEELRAISNGDGARGGLSLRILTPYAVPVPPLEVQREIVRILDHFTELTAELQAEIVLQKQRYSYYKDKFFEGIDKKYYVPLKTIAKQERGKNKGQLIKEAFSVTQKGIIRTSDYFGNDTKITSENTSNYYVVKPGWFAYSPSRVNVGSFNYLRVNHDVIISPLNKVFSIDIDKMIPEFLYQYMTSTIGFSSMLRYREGIEGTGRWHLEFDDMAKMEIPLIPMEKQSEIIERLMKFDTLCADISSGLPAEIEARQKQYEYYRDKLLTFKPLS